MMKHFCVLTLLFSIFCVNTNSNNIKSQSVNVQLLQPPIAQVENIEAPDDETKQLRLTSPFIAALLRFPAVVKAIFTRSGRCRDSRVGMGWISASASASADVPHFFDIRIRVLSADVLRMSIFRIF